MFGTIKRVDELAKTFDVLANRRKPKAIQLEKGQIPEEEYSVMSSFAQTDWDKLNDTFEINDYFWIRSRFDDALMLYFDLRIFGLALKKAEFNCLAVDIIVEHHSGGASPYIGFLENDGYFSKIEDQEVLAFIKGYAVVYEKKWGSSKVDHSTWNDTTFLLAIRNMSFLYANWNFC